MKGLKQRLKRPVANSALPKLRDQMGVKDSKPSCLAPADMDAAWTRQDQRVWQAVAGNQPAKVAAKLGKHPDVDVNRICPNVGYSVVHYAAAKGLDDCLNILLAHRADASSCDITGATPLHAAARYGHKGTTSKLLASRSIKINLADKNHCTALHFAAFEGHADCVKLIADAPEVDLNCTDKDGRTPIMVAAAMGHTEVCKDLVERKCDLQHQDNGLGHTALTLAADSGHADVVRLLYDHGANHTDALNDGRTALQLAKQKDRKSVINALHVVQLTEAANRSSDGPRLSTSSSKFKSDDLVKKRHSVDCILDTATYIDDLVAGTHLSTGSRTPKPSRRNKEEKKATKSNISRVKAAVGAKMKSHSRRGSDASGLSSTSTPRQKKKMKDLATGVSPESNAMSLYTDGSTNFYEHGMKFFESNSSLDISSTSSPMNNMSKSMDSLRKTPEELDRISNGTTGFSEKVEGTDFSRRQNDVEISQLKKLNRDYERKIKELEECLARATEVSVVTEKLQKNAEEVNNAQLNEDYEKKIKELEERLSHDTKVSRATEELQKNAEEVRNAQMAAAMEEHERKEVKMESEIEEFKQNSVKLEKQNKELLRRLNSVQQTTMNVENLKEQIRKNDEISNALRDENQTLTERIEKLEAENKKMLQEVEKEKANGSSIISQAKQKIIEAEQRCNQVERNAAEVEQQRDVAVLRINEVEDRCKELETGINALENELAQAEQKNKEMDQKCTEAARELKDVEQQREETELKLGDVTKDKRKVERELKKVKEFSGRESMKSAKYETELDDISRLLLQCGLIEQRQGDHETSIISNVKTDVQRLIEKLEKGGSQRSPRNKQPKKAQNQAEEGQLNHTEAKKKDLEEKLNTSVDERNKKIGELQKEILNSQEVINKKTAECSRLDSELKHTKTRLTKLEAEKKNLEEDFCSELTNARAELATFQATKLAHADDFSRSRDESNDLRQQLDQALNALEKQREESVPRDSYEADCAKIRQDADILKKEVSKMLEKCALEQLELANKEQEISDLRVERNQSEARSSKFENEVSHLKLKCEESDVQVNVFRQQLTDMKHKLDKALEEVNSLRKSRRDMTIRLAAKHGEINEMEKKKVENLKKQIDNLSSHVQESEKRYRDTVAIYRGHLLAAVTGQLNTDVQQALEEIINLRGKDDDKIQIPHT